MTNDHINIFNKAKGFLLSKGATEDDIQEGYIRVLRSKTTFDNRGDIEIRNYFITVCLNCRNDRTKIDKRLGFVNESQYEYDNDGSILNHRLLQDYLIKESTDDYKEIVERKFYHIYNKATSREKKIIRLRYFNDMTYNEISKVLDLNINTIKHQIHKIKIKALKWEM